MKNAQEFFGFFYEEQIILESCHSLNRGAILKKTSQLSFDRKTAQNDLIKDFQKFRFYIC